MAPAWAGISLRPSHRKAEAEGVSGDAGVPRRERSQRNGPDFHVCRFHGKGRKWAEFSSEWVRWLHSEPRIEYLKMYEAVRLKGQFGRFSKVERDRKLRGCIAILKQYPQEAIQVSVNIADYQGGLAKEQPLSIRDPYFLAFFGILSGVCYDVIDTGVPDQIEIFFDEHSIFKPRIDYWYSIMRDQIGELHDPALANVLPPNPIFKSDLEFVPLQAADVLAWLFRNAYSGNRNEFEWIAEELIPVMPMSHYATLYDAERMKNVLRLTDEMAKKITPEMIAETKRDPRWRKMTRMKSKPKKHGLVSEFDKFDRTMRDLIKVPRDEIKAKLDAEKAAKKRKPKRTSASTRTKRKELEGRRFSHLAGKFGIGETVCRRSETSRCRSVQCQRFCAHHLCDC